MLIYYAALIIISLFILQQGYSVGRYQSTTNNYLLGIIVACSITLLTYLCTEAGIL